MRHLICVTIDTDPDGLSGKEVNRRSLSWEGLAKLRELPRWLTHAPSLSSATVPVTWFVRADGQLRDVLGSSLHLLEAFEPLWSDVRARGDELGWHPHLYRQPTASASPTMITEPGEVADELGRLWEDLASAAFAPTAFRNGEGWHTQATLATIEGFGIPYDSTAIPGRRGSDGHPMDWRGAPNRPYYPAADEIRVEGPSRRVLELPMNTWHVRAPYDEVPRLRYMNPAIHESIFASALAAWPGARESSARGHHVWVLIAHPDDVTLTGEGRPDPLYARSPAAFCRNLAALARAIEEAGHVAEFTTISRAGAIWRSIAEGAA